ncbi:MAG: hypothetical protein OMM_08469, partial [Candidatus Magnetoglobus multicellularis str. Araruama]
PESDGIYYIQITSSDDSEISDFNKTFYHLSISFNTAEPGGAIAGNIYDLCNDFPLEDVTIKIINKENNRVLFPQLSKKNGSFFFPAVPRLNNGMLLFNKMLAQYHIDFKIEPTQIKVYDKVIIQIDDLNLDNQIGLSDIIYGLQVLSNDEIEKVNNDCVSLSKIISLLKIIGMHSSL